MSPPNALQRFAAATGRDRWWTTAELAVHLVQSGLWTECGLPDPYTHRVTAFNGPRAFRVVQDEEDLTIAIEQIMHNLCLRAAYPDRRLPFAVPERLRDALPLFGFHVVLCGSDDGGEYSPVQVFKQTPYLTLEEVRRSRDLLECSSRFAQQHADDRQVVEETMSALGTPAAGGVLPETEPVDVVWELVR